MSVPSGELRRKSAWTPCSCGRGRFDPGRYSSCYECSAEQRAEMPDCLWCGRVHGSKIACCKSCAKIGDREDDAAHIRRVTFGRDHYRCRRCHRDDEELFVVHTEPPSGGGPPMPWRLYTLCITCKKARPDVDVEMRDFLLRAYLTELREYLTADERVVLRGEVAVWRGAHGVVVRPATGAVTDADLCAVAS